MQEESTVVAIASPVQDREAEISRPQVKDRTGWVRLSEERSFGSLTGSEFRVWGED